MLKKICDKYHIFGSIIEDIDEEWSFINNIILLLIRIFLL
jgi:hypothetical protein